LLPLLAPSFPPEGFFGKEEALGSLKGLLATLTGEETAGY
jgi:hypothetical protein